MHFLLSHGEQVTADSVRVDSRLGDEPDDELIELLQAGVNRRFDKIRENLESFVADGKKDLERMRNKPAKKKAVSAVKKPAVAEDGSKAEKKNMDSEKSSVKKLEDMSVEDDMPVDLVEDLKIDL